MTVFDRLAALAGLVMASPVLLLLVPLIRLTSPGPAIFVQPRVGRKKKVFRCLKLRTMYQDTKQLGTHEVSAAAVTRLGRFLRATKIDEIPQLVNVLRGEMSLVGPRPCLPSQEELIAERDRRGIFEVKPGITGLGQILGIDMSDPVKLADCEERYLSRKGLRYDLRLLLLTVMGAGRGDRTASKID